MQDSYNRNITYMRISVTELCNLRCKYCMPAEGVCKKSHDEMLTEEELIQAIEIAAELGVNKIRITGGEPLVKRNIISICEKVHDIAGIETLGITTNGILLPQYGKALKAAGVNRVNISLDTLDAAKFSDITRGGNLEDTLAGLHAALELGFEKIKINAVLIKGFNDDEIRALAELTLRYPIDVRFIEFMPMLGETDLHHKGYVSNQLVLDTLPELAQVSNTNNEGCEAGSPSRLYRLPGALGNVGLISPISSCFCSECNRIRLTADGKIKPCLHSSQEILIRGLERSAMKKAFEQAILEKPKSHKITASHASSAGRSMNQIGG